MLKVVIVDDEMLVRVGLKSTIHWEENGFIIVGEAANGEEALSVCQDVLPDIILTDIKMPYMNGLEFHKKLSEYLPSAKIIVLSCYDDFEFVKEALKLGAVDYILKPTMSPKYLLDVMHNIKLRINNERAAISEVTKLKDEVLKSKEILKEELLRDIIFNEIYTGIEIEDKFVTLSIKISKQNLHIILIRMDKVHYNDNSYVDQNNKLLHTAFQNILREILKDYTFIEFVRKNDEYIIISSFQTLVSRGKIIEEIHALCSKIRSTASKYLNVSVSLGISGTHIGYENITKAYKEAEIAVEKRFYDGHGIISIFTSINKCEDNTDMLSLVNQFPLHKAIEEDNLGLFKHYLTSILELLRYCSINKIKQACVQLIFFMFEECRYIDTQLSKIVDKYDPYNQIYQFDTLHNIKEYITKIAEEMIDACRCVKESVSITNRAILYIKTHYHEDLSLTKVTNELNISKNYFCQLFKSEIGQSFISYLTHYRIEKAKELVVTTNLKYFEIAVKVGIPDFRHFSRTFRKVAGFLPSEYRKSRSIS